MILDGEYGLKNGFTLVELSIVLVILGLLAGGVLTGQSLIEAAKKRKVITFHEQTISAFFTFKDKYFALPGDMSNATSFWGRSSDPVANCLAQPGTASATGTCNGNGDGYLIYSGRPNESALIWQHLKLAGLLVGSQAGEEFGQAGAVQGVLRAPGQANSVYSWLGGWSAAAQAAALYGDGLAVGGSVAKGIAIQTAMQHPTGSWYNAAFATPEYVWSIDSKVDDGNPVTGKFFGLTGSDPNDAGGANFTTCLTGAGSVWEYNLTTTTSACRMMWQIY